MTLNSLPTIIGTPSYRPKHDLVKAYQLKQQSPPNRLPVRLIFLFLYLSALGGGSLLLQIYLTPDVVKQQCVTCHLAGSIKYDATNLER